MDSKSDYINLKNWLIETQNEPLETMTAFFDNRINDYEEHMSHWNRHYKWMAELIPFSAKTILDIGCGTGLELDCIYKKMPTVKVTGIDLSSEMLDTLKRKHSNKLPNLIQGDYFLHDFGENCFDVALSFETLHHFTAEKKMELFQNIFRSLMPGGIYLECDYIAVSRKIEDLVFSECNRRRNRDGIAPDVFVHFDTPLTLKHEIQAIKSAGFSSVDFLGFLPDDNHTAMIRAIK